MKRFFACVLSAALCLSLAACGGESPAAAETETNSAETEAAVIETTVPETTAPETTAPAPELTVPEQVIVDNEKVKITVTGIDMENGVGPTLLLKVENKSDKIQSVADYQGAINGCMISTVSFTDVNPGETLENISFTFMDSDIEAAGIQDLAEMQISLLLFEDNNMLNGVFTEMLPVETSLTGVAEPSYNDSGKVVFEDDNVRMVYQGDAKNAFDNPYVLLMLENKTDKELNFKATELTAAGQNFTPLLSVVVTPGMRAISAVSFDSDDLEAAGLTELSDVAVNIAYSSTDYSLSPVETGMFSLGE